MDEIPSSGAGQRRFPIVYRRARSVLWLVGLFWLWLFCRGFGLYPVLFVNPAGALLGIYALSVGILASLGFGAAALVIVVRHLLRTRDEPSVAQLVNDAGAAVRGLVRDVPRRAQELLRRARDVPGLAQELLRRSQNLLRRGQHLLRERRAAVGDKADDVPDRGHGG